MSKPVEAEKENAERWVLSYADLVTLLLGFFIILYATSEVDIQKFESIGLGLARAFNVDIKESGTEGSPIFDGGTGIIPDTLNSSPIDRDLELIREALRKQSEASGVAEGRITVSSDDQKIVIRLADTLIFSSASAALRAGALPLLDIVGAVLHGLPNEIRVEGHTDNVPVGTERYPTNWELSSARATAVLRYLVEEGGLDPERTFAAGYGEFRAIAPNLTPEGRALNRRADIVVLYPPAQIPAEPLGIPANPAGPVFGEE